jgi:hypothetical protein
MKIAAWAAASLLVCFSAWAEVPVFLIINPADQGIRETPITLTADLGRQFGFNPTRLRYTFTAQRSWPCADSFTIAQNSANRTVTWTAPKAGIYTFEVEVTNLPSKNPAAPSSPAQLVGRGRKANYKVTPSGFVGKLIPTFAPVSGATAPVALKLSVSAMTVGPLFEMPTYYRLIARVDCQGGCNPTTCTGEGLICNFTLPAAGAYSFSAAADEISPWNCDWVGSGSAQLGSYTAK